MMSTWVFFIVNIIVISKLKMESELKCSICSSQYKQDNLPRLLSTCGHTFCEICLDTMITVDQQNRHRVVCHLDNIATYLDGSDVSQFPKNTALINILFGKKNQNPNNFKEESLDVTKILHKDHSHGDQTESDLINLIDNGKKSNSRQQTKSKVQVSPIQQPLKKEQYQICLPHQKPMDVVCLEQMIKICAKCAIFGEHKGHEFKSIENIEVEWNQFREDITKIYERKDALVNLISNEESSKCILDIFDQNKRKLQKDLAQRFKKLKEEIKRVQENAMKTLENLTNKAQERVRGILKLDPILEREYQKWEDDSFGLIIRTEQCNFEEKLKILYNYNNARLITQGQNILQKIKNQQKNIPNSFESIIQSIVIDSNDSILESLASYVRVIESSASTQVKQAKADKNIKGKSPFSFQQSLLEYQNIDHKMQILNQNNMNSFQLSYEPMKIETATSISHNILTPYKKQRTSFHEETGETYLSQEKIEKPPKKKLKLIKVPQKIEKTLELLYNDTIDLLDLTNAQLGDSTILQICQFLRGSKVRVAKFIRNKLTDDVIPKMIPSLGNIITLYLSQNLLTQQTLEYLIVNRNSMTNLKSVILSQNKIIQRKHKMQIERLRKLDLIVSV